MNFTLELRNNTLSYLKKEKNIFDYLLILLFICVGENQYLYKNFIKFFIINYKLHF
jgi:hypothetical protein